MTKPTNKNSRLGRLKALSLSPLTSALAEAFKSGATASDKAAPSAQLTPSRVRFEALEPRVLLSADINPAQTITGSIDAPGETDQYAFHLDQGARVVFDSLTNNPDITWSLTKSQDQQVAASSFTADSVLQLEAGYYQINISAVDGHTGAYQFRLADGSTAQSLVLGGPVTGTLDTGMQSLLYQFNANAGEQFDFQAQAVTGGNANWRLIGPAGQEVVSSRSLNNDSRNVIVGQTGNYWLLVEGQSNTADTIQFGFTLNQGALTYSLVAADTKYLKAKFNSVGREDLLEVSHAQSGEVLVRQFLATENGYQAGVFAVLGSWSADNQYLLGDLNEDGRSDLVEVRRQPDGTVVANTWLAVATGFVAGATTSLGSGYGPSSKYYLADTTGDQKADLIVQSWPGNGTTRFRVWQGDGQGFVIKGSVDVTGEQANARTMIGDFNGDGRADVGYFWQNPSYDANLQYHTGLLGRTDGGWDRDDQGNSAFGVFTQNVVWLTGNADGDTRQDALRVWKDGSGNYQLTLWRHDGANLANWGTTALGAPKGERLRITNSSPLPRILPATARPPRWSMPYCRTMARVKPCSIVSVSMKR